MRNSIIKILPTMMIFVIIMVGSCSKKNGGGLILTPVVPKEESIVFSIDPDPGTVAAVAMSGTYAFKVTVGSKLTSSGVKVDLTTKKDADNSTVDSKSLDSTTPGIDLSTSKLSPGILCTVTITVTSKATPTNTATKSFKVARK
jgi:hypothetical protein